MANKTVESYIKCPFYLREQGNLITCEGFVKNTCMTTKFRGSEEKKAHLRRNCFCEDGGACFMAASLFRKYEEEED